MIEVNFKDCCMGCDYVDVDYDDIGISPKLLRIGCCHSHVCGAWQQSDRKLELLTQRPIGEQKAVAEE